MRSNRRVLFVQHQDDCPPGYVGDRLAAHGADVVVARAHDALPDARDFDLVVPLGSEDAAYDDSLPYLANEWQLLSTAVDAGVPVFGICFGAQLLSRVLGGQVRRAANGPEIGWRMIESKHPDLVEPGPWLVWHLDVMTAPPGADEIAHTLVGTQAFVCGPHVGVQFHPEVTPESVDVWAQHCGEELGRAGVDHGTLVAETSDRQAEARRRAYVLTDRIVERAAARTAA